MTDARKADQLDPHAIPQADGGEVRDLPEREARDAHDVAGGATKRAPARSEIPPEEEEVPQV